MTRTINNWWRKISFWNKLRSFIGLLGIGGEITLYFGDSYMWWKIVAGIATAISFGIIYIFEDKDNNGIVDTFEK